MSPVLVTGGTGYVATQLIARLLRDGREVRTTARSLQRESVIRAAVERGGSDSSQLTVVAADLTSDEGWAAAMAGVEEVHHVASPLPVGVPTDPEELIGPARDGALRALRFARDAGARRVVLTSSFAAIGYSPKPVRDFDETDWTDPDTPGLAPYPRSKTVAECAAWDWVAAEGAGLELVVVNPTFVLGPTLTTEIGSSMTLIKMMLEGTTTAAPRQRFGVVDVRDVADAHVRAMATEGAAGQRFLVLADGPTLTFLEVAQTLRAHLGELGSRTPTVEAPGDELVPVIIRNDRAREQLGWRPRPVVDTIVETGQCLHDLGLLKVED